jgi:tetratricopeptide (TPR) repeat protein
VLTAEGQLRRAESLYTAVEQQSPGDPNTLAALGTIALREDEESKAIDYWREAIDDGITDADVCYRYAVLAEKAGLPPTGIQHALERAVLLRPGFDDARYKLALLKSNAGDFSAAVNQLRAIRNVLPARAFSYWSALSYASMELGDRTVAKQAAQEAGKCAHTESERLRANQLAYMADTDLTVQFVHDADGRPRLVETRVPHGTSDWNPFVEPTDRIQQAEGQLQEIICSSGKLTGILVDTAKGRLTLAVPDPQHVLMRNGPAEFTCGPQQPKPIKVQYTSAYANANTEGIVRGIAFR